VAVKSLLRESLLKLGIKDGSDILCRLVNDVLVEECPEWMAWIPRHVVGLNDDGCAAVMRVKRGR
jgi:hypothetical protein